MSNDTFITAPVRIVQGTPVLVYVGAVIQYDGIPHVISATEQHATVLRIHPVDTPSLYSYIFLGDPAVEAARVARRNALTALRKDNAERIRLGLRPDLPAVADDNYDGPEY